MEQSLPPIEPGPDPLVLHRFSVKPGHVEQFRELWPRYLALRDRHGFVTHRVFLETRAEPKLTWLYAHADPASGEARLAADPDQAELTELARPHVFRNVKVRPVRAELLTHATAAAVVGRTAILRRYSIVGSWTEFLDVWRRIVPVRERHGFRCLFAVADEPENMFTWAFDFDGAWDDFPQAQRGYYRDPDRVALRGVFDYMADYAIEPAEQWPVP